MRAINFILAGTVFLALASCSEGAKTEEKSTYSLDAETSSLKWKGSEGPEYFHSGSVKVTKGSIEMEDDKLISGNFTIDLNTIKAEDKDMPEEKKAYLEEHLKDTSFLFVSDFPMVEVKVDGYENGKLSTTIKVRGVEIKDKIAVKLSSSDKKATIKGKFLLDLADLKMPGMEPEPGSDEKIDSKVEFEMDLTLKKK